ncbi:low molecular weight phosphatase family protein [Actinotalea sp. M2MS4P-6]|uniref:arsenate reductase/protein-tyrosine-phosphatase family protein n=1 Tax=Actinotalea sp. M2MS4P-6 TaxID=2983762 RepID=UPI0021E3AD7B|nr:low molecular weight phosphatase family protein [Actinotalea sp. M2MS4P-6]MCV2395864.1 low molecular weight phosphatase family protein [Actinotalea sp. M2MS4P-6]
MPPAPRVLVVCTGNICRSPLAATLLGAILTDTSVGSAGTHAVVGAPIDPTMVEVAGRHGTALPRHAAIQLSPAMVRAADLVLAMTRGHRSAIVAAEPAALRRTLTLRELARLVSQTPLPGAHLSPGARLVAALPDVLTRRRANPDGPELDDVDDPYRGPVAAYQRAFAEIDEAVRTLATALA